MSDHEKRESVETGCLESGPGLPETRRLEGFSDAAFSIIITLLVLEIHRPAVAPGKLGAELLAQWSSYAAYAVAFIYVGIISTTTTCSSGCARST